MVFATESTNIACAAISLMDIDISEVDNEEVSYYIKTEFVENGRLKYILKDELAEVAQSFRVHNKKQETVLVDLPLFLRNYSRLCKYSKACKSSDKVVSEW